MSFTLGNTIFLVGMLLASIGVGFIAYYSTEYSKKNGIIAFLICLMLTFIVGVGINWYNTSTASGIRTYKDWKSEINNGIEREITITAEDGREIFHYEGKVDIESNHEDNYIKFEGEDGRRYMIYYGIQDTILIIEK